VKHLQGMMGVQNLVQQVKDFQRESPANKDAWHSFCDARGGRGGVRDPARHDENTLREFLGSSRSSSMMGMSGAGGMKRKMSSTVNPAPKASPYVSRSVAGVVDKVKEFQKSNPSNKELWHAFCDTELGGNRDPARHDAQTLQRFLTSASMGGWDGFGVALQANPTPNKKRRAGTPGLELAGENESKMLISNRGAAAVIGKGAQTLARLREAHGCRVEVMPKNVHTERFAEDRIVLLQGPLHSRQECACAILQLAYSLTPQSPQQTDVMQFKAVLPRGKALAVIGSGGQKLKYIREQSGVAVQVEKEEFNGERIARTSNLVSHPPQQVFAAARLIMEISETPKGAF